MKCGNKVRVRGVRCDEYAAHVAPQQFTTPLDLELADVIALLVVHMEEGTSLVGQQENTACRYPVCKKDL